ncbi:MAG: HD domain-containing protein [Candidatus Aceula meridiana]|nr:HD domain-containing protein [Candidatus Aceula meridiana]
MFLVGGALRDYVLGRECIDFDFATDKNAIKIAKSFAKKIKGAFVLLDEEHQCARVARKEKGKLFTYDFADFRAKTLKGDLAHRDFTVNAISADICDLTNAKAIDKHLIDPLGGLKDLKAKRVKMASAKAFIDDPLRLVRGFSLEAVLGFKLETKTLARIKKDQDLLGESARERIREELFKILLSPRAFATLKKMNKIGLLEKIIPQINVMFHMRQAGGYHHLSLWAHSLETLNQLEKIFKEFEGYSVLSVYLSEPLAFGHSRQSLMKLAALLHDIGKPETYRREKGKISFHGHEHAGRRIVRDIAKFLKLSTQERTALEMLTLYHLRPGYLSNFKKPTPRARFRYFRDSKTEAISVLLLSLADQRSTRGPMTTAQDLKHHEKIIRELIEGHYNKKEEKKVVRLLTGDDLIKKLKLKPSPLFKKILAKAEEAQALGKIKTRQEALGLARKMVK